MSDSRLMVTSGMRVLLIIVLTVAQIVGPWLCCCGPVQVALVPDRPKPIAAPMEDHGDCPHCKKETPKPTKEQPTKTPNSPDDCPCCALMPVPLPADKPQMPVTDGLLVILIALVPQPIPLASVSPRSIVGLRELPLLPTEERLFAHHVLRC